MGDQEEQEQELEALQSIYPQELSLLSSDTFELTVVSSRSDDSSDSLAPPRALVLRCSFPSDYPSQNPPVFELEGGGWGDEAEERAMHAHLAAMFTPGEVVVFLWAEWLRERLAELDAQDVALAEALRMQEEEVSGGAAEDEGCEEGDVDEELLIEMMQYTKFVSDESEAWSSRIVHGDTIVDRKSVFQAHLARVTSPQEVEAMTHCLLLNNKIARATHNIMAYRVTLASGTVMGDCDDDGESAAGGRLLHMLSILDARDCCVVVSRWYGGIHLGPDRFKHINNAARTLMMANPKMWSDDSKGKGKGGGKHSKSM